MSLVSQVAYQVAGDVRSRGRPYYTSGAVSILAGDNRSVRAKVQGTELYHVSLKRTRKSLKVACSCPYYEDRLRPCKHIWATILAADAKGYLRGAGGGGRLRVVDDEEATYEWAEESPDSALPSYDEYDDDWEEPVDQGFGYPSRPGRPPSPPPPRRRRRNKARAPGWKDQLATLRKDVPETPGHGREHWPVSREIVYLLDVPATVAGQGLTLEIAHRQRKSNRDWGKLKNQRISINQVAQLPDPVDRQILSLLLGAQQGDSWGATYYSPHYYNSVPNRVVLSDPQEEALLPQISRTGRFHLRLAANTFEETALQWDEGEPWEFWLEVMLSPSGKDYSIRGSLRRAGVRVPLEEPALLLAGGWVFFKDRVARFKDFGAFGWVPLLRQNGPVSAPLKKSDELLKELLTLPQLPKLDLPDELRFDEVVLPARPRLKVSAPKRRSSGTYERLEGELAFDYGGEVVAAEQKGRAVYQSAQRRLIVRDAGAEQAAADKLTELGFRPNYDYYDRIARLELAPRNLPRVVRELLAENWHVEAEGKLYRQPGSFHMEVTSGIDWFELHGGVRFGDAEAKLPELLAALKKGDNTVVLGDGTFGILPDEWLKKYGMLAGLGKAEGDHLRFTRTQVGLLDALLASQPEATCDEVFAQAREQLRRFQGVEAIDPPAGFVGQLRAYQCDGLGWLGFLEQFGFGGCLADDMGLGKTVQVLALLESRRELRRDCATANGSLQRPGPSLVVVPKSLVFNWKQEALRFAPQLRVLDHTGAARTRATEHFDDYDLVLTTYGTLRRDVAQFKDVQFDYCILDEAQAVKNASTESAKAVRLLRGEHRLALSGTPVENHLGELWSLFEFLNPGMLGSASVFRLAGGGARNPSEETRNLLARGLRPFILRRTKDQVAKDLPQKTEQTLYCEMEPSQRKLYDELREHYRRALLKRVETEGMNKVKMQVLEALLRLRQASCHPALIDKERKDAPSAKLDLLLPQLAEVMEEGHKALVFSQFTSFLAIVRDRLDQENIPYEYLDGRTRNRAEKVERFQSDPDCKLFLISLKAGGLGLNLTAAEYVFLLDPWWNPAVEAQAIDRAHRIGQTESVFAYRLIARDTVEEKVLELQKTKRALADAIINADNSLVRNLGREDLELLLS